MKFENLYIECENLEQRDEVFGLALEYGYKRWCGRTNELGVFTTFEGKVFDLNWYGCKDSDKFKKLTPNEFFLKYKIENKMIENIEKAMAELKLNRHELSSALGMSRPYITKMLTCPQSEKTQARVVKIIDELMQSGGAKNIPIPDSAEKFLLNGIIDARDKTIKELNQVLEYKDQLLARGEDEFQKKSKELRECKCDFLELSKTVASYQDENSKLSLKISTQQKSIEDKASELLDCKMDNSNIRTELKALKRENKDIQVHHAIVCVILIILVAWGFYV